MEIRNRIDELNTLEDVVTEMKKIGENYIKSSNMESRLLADWIYRFALKIDNLRKSELP